MTDDERAVLDAKGAITRHVQWKITLQMAIAMREQLTPLQMEQIRHHRRCAIGRWLDSPATTEMRLSAAYHDLVQRHIEFHRDMERVANLIEEQRFEEADRAMDAFSGFQRAARALGLAVTVYDGIMTMSVPV
jgi:methyl-accepting chemotaxis protein